MTIEQKPPASLDSRSPGPAGLNRRELFEGGAAAGAIALLAACRPGTGGVPATDTVAAAAAGGEPFVLQEASIAELQGQMAGGQRTAKEITQLYLDRIKKYDRGEVDLRSVIETNPDALVIAEALDVERAAGRLRGPLHGIPILLKDNIATGDQMQTTAGSLALAGSSAPQDSFVAARLRDAGAVLLGKANLSEWANIRSEMSSSGWSGRGGQCKNPYMLSRNPCGSSSGSGAAVSANFTAAAIGTETNGSIVCPATRCGVVGIKPTVGLVSRSRIIPISATQDTAGPMARTVRDAAAVLGALVGLDPEDPATTSSEGRSYTDYTQFLDEDGLRGARIGVGRQFFGFHPQVDEIMEQTIVLLRERGAEIVDDVTVLERGALGDSSYTVLLYELKAGLADYFATLGANAPVKTLADVIAFNKEHAETSMPFFAQDILELAESKGTLDEKEYKEARAKALRLARSGIDNVMNKHHLDAVLGPTGGPAWLTDHINGDPSGGGGCSTPAAVAGYPHITVPAGAVSGLPVGVSFFGRAWSEPVLLRVAYAFEQASKARRVPRFEA